tara:strand:- start:1933 stop:2154 length:222 start_codon:yes stop_codon:yes gene_type:complete
MKYIEAEVEITFRKKIFIARANWDQRAEDMVKEKASQIVFDKFEKITILGYKRADSLVEPGLTGHIHSVESRV